MFEAIPKLMREAAGLILGAHDVDGCIDSKAGDANFVTAYDVAVQSYLFRELGKCFPEAVFIGEESEEDRTASLAEQLCFVIDPIDGTTNFIHNYHKSAISVGVAEGGRIVYGAVYDPYLKLLYRAERGCGAFVEAEDGTSHRIHVSSRPLHDALSCFGTSPYYREELGDVTFERAKWLFMHTRDLRRSGSAALDLCAIAEGAVDIFFEYRLSPWDYAAGSLIIEEAGGVITRFDGSPVTLDKPCSILAGNTLCHGAAMESSRFCE